MRVTVNSRMIDERLDVTQLWVPSAFLRPAGSLRDQDKRPGNEGK